MARMLTQHPARKVYASTLGAAFATLLIYGIEKLTGGTLPGNVQGALITITVFGAGYLTPPALHDQVVSSNEKRLNK